MLLDSLVSRGVDRGDRSRRVFSLLSLLKLSEKKKRAACSVSVVGDEMPGLGGVRI